jgi:hypothetical protein
MKKWIHIEKVAEAEGGLPAIPKEQHEAGTAQDNNHSLPIDYWIEGKLIGEIKTGDPVSVMRHIRNGVSSDGFFQTSPVTEFTPTQFKTQNSVYNYWFVPEPEPCWQ